MSSSLKGFEPDTKTLVPVTRGAATPSSSVNLAADKIAPTSRDALVQQTQKARAVAQETKPNPFAVHEMQQLIKQQASNTPLSPEELLRLALERNLSASDWDSSSIATQLRTLCPQKFHKAIDSLSQGNRAGFVQEYLKNLDKNNPRNLFVAMRLLRGLDSTLAADLSSHNEFSELLRSVGGSELLDWYEANRTGDSLTSSAIVLHQVMATTPQDVTSIVAILQALRSRDSKFTGVQLCEVWQARYASSLENDLLKECPQREQSAIKALLHGTNQDILREQALSALGLRGGLTDIATLNRLLNNCNSAEREQLLKTLEAAASDLIKEKISSSSTPDARMLAALRTHSSLAYLVADVCGHDHAHVKRLFSILQEGARDQSTIELYAQAYLQAHGARDSSIASQKFIIDQLGKNERYEAGTRANAANTQRTIDEMDTLTSFWSWASDATAEYKRSIANDLLLAEETRHRHGEIENALKESRDLSGACALSYQDALDALWKGNAADADLKLKLAHEQLAEMQRIIESGRVCPVGDLTRWRQENQAVILGLGDSIRFLDRSETGLKIANGAVAVVGGGAVIILTGGAAAPLVAAGYVTLAMAPAVVARGALEVHYGLSTTGDALKDSVFRTLDNFMGAWSGAGVANVYLNVTKTWVKVAVEGADDVGKEILKQGTTLTGESWGANHTFYRFLAEGGALQKIGCDVTKLADGLSGLGLGLINLLSSDNNNKPNPIVFTPLVPSSDPQNLLVPLKQDQPQLSQIDFTVVPEKTDETQVIPVPINIVPAGGGPGYPFPDNGTAPPPGAPDAGSSGFFAPDVDPSRPPEPPVEPGVAPSGMPDPRDGGDNPTRYSERGPDNYNTSNPDLQNQISLPKPEISGGGGNSPTTPGPQVSSQPDNSSIPGNILTPVSSGAPFRLVTTDNVRPEVATFSPQTNNTTQNTDFDRESLQREAAAIVQRDMQARIFREAQTAAEQQALIAKRRLDQEQLMYQDLAEARKLSVSSKMAESDQRAWLFQAAKLETKAAALVDAHAHATAFADAHYVANAMTSREEVAIREGTRHQQKEANSLSSMSSLVKEGTFHNPLSFQNAASHSANIAEARTQPEMRFSAHQASSYKQRESEQYVAHVALVNERAVKQEVSALKETHMPTMQGTLSQTLKPQEQAIARVAALQSPTIKMPTETRSVAATFASAAQTFERLQQQLKQVNIQEKANLTSDPQVLTLLRELRSMQKLTALSSDSKMIATKVSAPEQMQKVQASGAPLHHGASGAAQPQALSPTRIAPVEVRPRAVGWLNEQSRENVRSVRSSRRKIAHRNSAKRLAKERLEELLRIALEAQNLEDLALLALEIPEEELTDKKSSNKPEKSKAKTEKKQVVTKSALPGKAKITKGQRYRQLRQKRSATQADKKPNT